MNICYGKFLGFLGLSAIAFLGSGLTALSQENEQPRPPFEVRLVPPDPSTSGGGSCFDGLKDLTEKDKAELRSKRVELYYYRNAGNIARILSRVPIKG